MNARFEIENDAKMNFFSHGQAKVEVSIFLRKGDMPREKNK